MKGVVARVGGAAGEQSPVDAKQAVHGGVRENGGHVTTECSVANVAIRAFGWMQRDPSQQTMQVNVLLRSCAIARGYHLIVH